MAASRRDGIVWGNAPHETSFEGAFSSGNRLRKPVLHELADVCVGSPLDVSAPQVRSLRAQLHDSPSGMCPKFGKWRRAPMRP